MSQQEQNDKSQYFYRASAADFMKIPGGPLAYWLNENIYNLFLNCPNICTVSDPRQGMATTDNNTYLRLWHEVSFTSIGLSCRTSFEGYSTGCYWFPYNKGGEVRKWYGNQSFIVKYERDGKDLIDLVVGKYPKISDPEFVIKNRKYYFKDCITWTDLTSSMLSARYQPIGSIFDVSGHSTFVESDLKRDLILSFLNSKIGHQISLVLNASFHFQVGDYKKLPYVDCVEKKIDSVKVSKLINYSREDWDTYETSWAFTTNPMLNVNFLKERLKEVYLEVNGYWQSVSIETQRLEVENNMLFIEACNLQLEQNPFVDLKDITLNCNSFYRYGGRLTDEEREIRFQSDTLSELVSYMLGCMMGRYSIDKLGLILASQGETLQDYLNQIPSPRFMPDHDAILPLTDQEWFADDVTNRVREFVKVVWGEETLQENLTFIAESLCLHAIKGKKGESAIETIRRYLSTQFYKDHLKTYKKRPIYWLFSSGKEKAFECLVYLHRYNESTLARMRTEYVTPLMGKYDAQQSLLQEQLNDASPAQQRELEKQLKDLGKKQTELRAFDENLKHYADMRIKLDLDDGVKVNYGKFGNLLADVKSIATGTED